MNEPTTQPKVRVTRNQNAPIIYVEGVAQMMVGFPSSRLLLSNLTQQNEETGEIVHNVGCELVVPTAALIEIASGILKNLAPNKEQLKSVSAEWLSKVAEVIDTIPPNPEA